MHSESNNTQLKNDEPIESIEDDLVGVRSLVQNLVSAIRRASPEKAAYVIGLSGGWGSGKSSALNLVEEELSKSSSKNLVVRRFNPWMFQDQQSLLLALFDLLRKSAKDMPWELGGGKGKEVKKELGELLLEYSASVAYPSFNMMVSALGDLSANAALLGSGLTSAGLRLATKAAGKHLSKSGGSLTEKKDRIASSLKKLNGNIVVVIDDLDRLADEEICLIFKLVALTASFPHIIYLLSYDKSVVEAALHNIQHGDSAEYLDKIIQLPVEMPRLSDAAKNVLIENSINKAVDLGRFDLSAQGEQLRYHAILNDMVMRCLLTPRDCVRYSNLLESKAYLFRYEVNPTDLMAMTAIELFLPKVRSWLWDNSSFLLAEDWFGSEEERNSLLEEKRGELSREISYSSGNRLVEVSAFKPLFPALFRDCRNINHDMRESCRGAKAKGKACRRETFELIYGIDSAGSIKRAALLRLLNEADPGEIAFEMESMPSVSSFRSAVNDLSGMVLTVKDERLSVLLNGAFELLRRSRRSEFDGWMTINEAEVSNRFLEAVARRVGVEKSSAAIDEAVSLPDYALLEGLTYLLRNENLRRERGHFDETLLSDDAFVDLCSKYSAWLANDAERVLEQAKVFPMVMWPMVDDRSGASNFRRFKQSLNGGKGEILYFALKLNKLYELGSGLVRYSLGSECPSDSTLFQNDSIVSWIGDCSYEAQIRVAALCLLLDDGKPDEVEEEQAADQLKQWAL